MPRQKGTCSFKGAFGNRDSKFEQACLGARFVIGLLRERKDSRVCL